MEYERAKLKKIIAAGAADSGVVEKETDWMESAEGCGVAGI